MVRLLLLCLISIFTYANELDNLLDDFAEENDLSNETKIEKTGSTELTVYTRQDLDKLNYQSLKDILSMQRFFTYREGRTGLTDLIPSEPSAIGKAGQLIKISINDHELASLEYDSLISLIGNMKLDFIDHIEIYQGPPSFAITATPSLVSIKLYSKTPSRDNGNKIGVISDNYASSHVYFHTADNEQKLKYFIYVANEDNNRESITSDLTDLSRDEEKKHIFGTFEYDEHEFFLQYIDENQDGFLTNSYDSTPIKDDMEFKIFNFGYKKKFLSDDSLELKISYDQTNKNIDFMDDNPVTGQTTSNYTTSSALSSGLITDTSTIGYLSSLPGATPLTVSNSGIYGEQYQSKDKVFSIKLNKEYYFKNHDILTGISYLDKSLDFSKKQYITSLGTIAINGIQFISYDEIFETQNIPNYLTSQKLYNIFIEDSYSLNKNNTISLGAKIEREENSFYDDETLFSWRISHNYEKDKWSFQTYYTDGMANKVGSTRSSNKHIKNERFITMGHSTTYKNNNFNANYQVTHVTVKDLIYLNSSNILEDYNMSEDYIILLNSLNFKYAFNASNSLMIETWRQDIDIKEYNLKNYINGVNLRLINDFESITFVNELILLNPKKSITNMEDDIQFNTGITYKYNKDLSLFFKGENVFDMRKGYKYLNYENGTSSISGIDERYIIGIEYTF